MTDWDKDGKLDLVSILKRSGGHSKLGITVLSGASGFKKPINVYETAQPEVLDDSYSFFITDWDKDGKPDLVSILKRGGGGGKVGIALFRGKRVSKTY